MADEPKKALDDVKSGAFKKLGEYIVIGIGLAAAAIGGLLYGFWPTIKSWIGYIWFWLFHWKAEIPIWLLTILPFSALLLILFWAAVFRRKDQDELEGHELTKFAYFRDVFDGIVWQWRY